jgi:uncharacterized protein with FMN-binding domain
MTPWKKKIYEASFLTDLMLKVEIKKKNIKSMTLLYNTTKRK